VRGRRLSKLSVRRPAILFAIVLLLILTLTVLWNFVLVHDYNLLKELAGGGTFHTAFIVVGSALFLAIIALATVLAGQMIGSVRRTQRQSNFLASVSHELNSPLSAIRLFAQTLRQPDLRPEERANFAGKIILDVDRLSHVVANILRAAEVDRRGDELPVTPTEVELVAYLREYAEDARTVFAGRVEITLEGEEAWVEVDPLMFRQVLDNLVDNSIRYRSETPARVAVSVVQDGASTEIRFVDQGIGVPPHLLDRIFERFFRVDDGKARTGLRGMGIGLSVVRSIVRSHGGTVEARSEGPGRGTTIVVRLPSLERAGVEA